ncbi:acetyl-CoA synthetase-like protein [Xylaria digitata]|nr:acetyl-CoA synthetase-like protein [Xylaria digitata]
MQIVYHYRPKTRGPRSRHPDISFPTDVTIWEWLFEESSKYCPIAKYPEKELAGFVDAITKERVSWKDVKVDASYISTVLAREYNLNSGDTVSLFSRNTIWYPVMLFAAMRVGGVVSGASPAYNVEEMTYALRTANAKFIATHPASIDIAVEAARNAGIPKKHIFLLEGRVEGYTTIKELIGKGKRYGGSSQVPYHKIPQGKKNGDICALLSFSSGTTGLPKAVMISHQNVIAQSLQTEPITPTDQKKVLGVLPMFHITGLIHGMHFPLVVNAEVVMIPVFDMETMLAAITEYQIPEILVVPPILIRLMRDPIVDKYDLRCIKRIASGAAPVSEEILQLLKEKFPESGFKQGHGMTESCSCITAHPPWAYDYRNAHKVGTIVANTEVKVMKEDGTEADLGEPGEILARGPQVVMGYLNNEKATRETFDADGFLHTGDQGFVTIIDRIKELIKVKGIGVAPAELEDLLLGHVAVDDCAVLAIPDELTGERPKAFVVVKQAHGADEATGFDIIAYVGKNKVRHKWIKEVEFVKEIPKNPSGKILRRVLRDRAKMGRKGLVVAVQEPRARL